MADRRRARGRTNRALEPVIEAARERGLTSLPPLFETIDFSATIWPISIHRFEGFWFPTEVDFKNAITNITISFRNATFEGHAIFESSTFEYEAHFENAAFSATTGFNHARFQRYVPTFFGAHLHEGTFFHDVTWPPVPRNSPDDARRQADAYERLKLEMDRLNRHEAELRFFAKELTALRNCTPPHRACLIAAYGAISDYGRSISKPLLWVIVLWYAGGILNKVLAGWSTGMAIGVSAASLGGVLGLRREIFPEVLKGADWPVALLSAGQSIAGAVLLFLVGLALRNRFRIR